MYDFVCRLCGYGLVHTCSLLLYICIHVYIYIRQCQCVCVWGGSVYYTTMVTHPYIHSPGFTFSLQDVFIMLPPISFSFQHRQYRFVNIKQNKYMKPNCISHPFHQKNLCRNSKSNIRGHEKRDNMYFKAYKITYLFFLFFTKHKCSGVIFFQAI